ncbi:MAG: ribosomal protein S18-alanine N-acetyltransferase [Porticoccaceae bacterium]|nr:ribosomal protein S18-alanine N-acetyltransferase [Porticoccaceae bacterium]
MAKLPIDNNPTISDSAEAFGSGFSTRRAVRDDLPILLKIESEITPFPWSARQFGDSIDDHETYVLLKGKRVIAYLFYQQILDQAELLNIGVRSSFQGEGLGSRLLGFCLERIRGSATQLHLEVRASNFTAIGLYLSSGFKQVGERRAYYRSETGREDALLMTYDFPDSSREYPDT